MGDVNGNGIVTIADLVAMIDYVLGKPSDLFDSDLADINDDGQIDMSDVICVLGMVIGEAESIERSIDTLQVVYQKDAIIIEGSYNPKRIKISIQDATKLTIMSQGKRPFVCIAKGECPDGCLIVEADTTCTLIFNDLQLTSKQSAAISFVKKQKINIEVPKGKQCVLSDATYRNEGDGANACLYSKGTIDFSGEGVLTVSGNYNHGITSSKNIAVDGIRLIINNVVKNGILCDKFTLKKGQIDLHLQNDASKGIKTKEELTIKGGSIEGEATGGVVVDKGDISYCSLLKSDGSTTVSGGALSLKNYGEGGRCISVDKDLIMISGMMNLECHGDGGQYINTDKELDYYTPKCITVNGCTKLERGQINLLATGHGGKGLDSSDSLFIGRKEDDFISEDSLCLIVETKGKALVDDIDEDYRRGCPKAIKCDSEIKIFSGTLRLRTHGQGGEGIESKGSLRAYNATVMANCYDDGINTGLRCYIDGAHLFCYSLNNDGIDSNGKLSIINGLVAAISPHQTDESFDTNNGQLYIYGGTVIGIGLHDVIVSPQSTVPYFSTPSYLIQDGYQHGDFVNLEKDYFMSVSYGKDSFVSVFHDDSYTDAFITVASELFSPGLSYSISDGAKPQESLEDCLDGRVIIGGKLTELNSLFNFKP